MASASKETVELVVSVDNRLVKKKNTTSIIWDFFGIRIADKEIKNPPTFCLTCKTQVANKGSNTSNLFMHLKQKHPVIHAEAIKKNFCLSRPSKIQETQPRIQHAFTAPKIGN